MGSFLGIKAFEYKQRWKHGKLFDSMIQSTIIIIDNHVWIFLDTNLGEAASSNYSKCEDVGFETDS